MPRAILAQSALADRSRTVSSVSDELGVSPSTLRTWERRYGLGPAQRETGERRRYQPEDVDRLRAMIHHVRAGMSAAEAAKRALAESTLLPRRGPANAAQLRSVALSDDYQRLEEVIEAAVASHGLVHTWSRFADSLHETAAQVIGVALAWYGCDVRMLSSENYGGVSTTERFREYVRGGVPALTVVLGCGLEWAQTVENLVARYGVPTIMVGADAPEILSPQVQRVRTISACVEEALALLAPQADLELVGRS